LNDKEQSCFKALENLISLDTSGGVLPVYRNILGYSKAMALVLEKDREVNNIDGSENFVKLLAKLSECVCKCSELDTSSLSLESQNRENAYEAIKTYMKFNKEPNVTYSLHLLTWFSTGKMDDFPLIYGDKSGLHYSVAFHVWMKANLSKLLI